ncbi:GNAT family N-acetyltransferase [Coraliomargarita akajimensis]|uniref:GCN5-related N-acetyltransferase n=1 Tax=Coraliomargarita akajimensis (strain DSM 45221 / IAM 15411 / JCM 23193 / KCTC 12865 / 04OKA010-24) TaxID=583355 RepID=D5ENJ8_CORAD|nr:N-acetyltransferase [Coraliomargarita akajimensis]ADE55474.1 GCN5-related N-acetyltransferase [Coraliomargarita akajimensis DSM 45221]
MLKIRPASQADKDAIQGIHMSAFGENEGPAIVDLVTQLLDDTSSPTSLHLVAEQHGEPVAHVTFSPVWSTRSDNALGYILAPLAVHPKTQQSGVGTAIVNEGLRLIRQQALPYVFVYGDPKYYCRFGFELARRFTAPQPLQFPNGWQVLKLDPSSADQAETVRCVPALNKAELW